MEKQEAWKKALNNKYHNHPTAKVGYWANPSWYEEVPINEGWQAVIAYYSDKYNRQAKNA